MPDADAKIAFGKFHVMRHVVEAIDQVRRREQRESIQWGDRRLTGTKFPLAQESGGIRHGPLGSVRPAPPEHAQGGAQA